MNEKNAMGGGEMPADMDRLLMHSQGGCLRDNDVMYLRIRKEKLS